MRHFMIDLETMGLRPTSAIISIGTVLFNDQAKLDTFYTPVSLASCIEHGLTTCESTVKWWATQSEEARAAWNSPDAPSLESALKEFQDWVRFHSAVSGVVPWGNGADFDISILNNAFNALGADPPWKFYNHACFRTIKNMFKVEPPERQGTHHHALDDASYQVDHFHAIMRAHPSVVLA